MNNKLWYAKLAYIEHIFAHVNMLNTSVQKGNKDIITLRDKLIVFDKELCLRMKKFRKNNLLLFSKILEQVRNFFAPAMKNYFGSIQKAITIFFMYQKYNPIFFY